MRLAHIATYLIVGWFLIGSAIILFYQNVDGSFVRRPITFSVNVNALQTDKAVYHKGDPVLVHFAYCRYRSFSASTQWKLVNETVVFFPEQNYILKPECSDRWIQIGEIPSYAVLGPHHFEGTTAAYINALHTMYFNYRSMDFDVIK
jgi:hypothetical protein